MRQRFSRSALLLLALSLTLTSHANAANNRTRGPSGFSTEASISETFSYDSNPLRVSTGETDLFGSTTSPQLVIRRETPRSSFESDTQVDINQFNHSEFNSVDLHQKFELGTHNERWAASVRALIDYDTTRTSELTSYALNLPRVHRTKLTAAPQLTFKPNTTDSWSLNATASDVKYDNNAYIDYTIYSLTPSFSHRFDAQNTATIALPVQRYASTSGSKQTSQSIGPTIGWSTTITPRLTAQLTAGAQTTHKTGSNAGDADSWNYIYAGKILYKGQQDVIDFTAIRAREPFGNGTETLLTTVRAKARHAINPKLGLTADAMYRTADYEAAPGINLDHGWNAGGGFNYRLREDLDLDVTYNFKRERLTTITNNVDEHTVMLGATYRIYGI